MRHHKADKKLGRDPSHRQAMLRNMVTSFFKYDRIETTDARAKVLRPIVEKMITLAKKGDLHSRRQALSYLEDKNVVHKLFEETAKKLKERQSGYTQIIKKINRKGDNAPVSVIKLLIADSEVEKKPKKKTKATEAKKETKPKTVKKTAAKEKKAAVSKPKKTKASEQETKEDQKKE
ncbi:MAG: 50S ribosomal protein L17 [Desulfobacteraceae bacterium]|nr:MAG: 50S ribosomal protein L17 [Desulfobacteraceae bacterium]